MGVHHVKPVIDPVTLPEDKRPSFLGHALGYAFLVYLAAPALFKIGAPMAEALEFGLLASIVVGVPLGLLICWVRLTRAQEAYAREHANTIALTAEREANAILETCDRELSNLARWLREAEALIGQAQHEYSDRAFAPFWEAIEQAAGRLASFGASARRLKAENERYISVLSARRHDFPSCPLRGSLPDPGATLVAFRAVVRKGQTDHQFATIWEMMATRKAIIAGFSTFGEAVNNLSSSVSSAISDLSSTVSGQASLVLAEQHESIKLLRQQGKKLDNLQRHR